MHKILTLVWLTGLAVLSMNPALAQNNVTVGPRDEAPKIDTGGKPRPAVRPSDGRQVAVLNIQLQFTNGKFRRAELVDAKRIASIAPKVFARQGGDWEVRINGRRRNVFFVFSPGYLEADGTEGANNPYTYVPQNGTVNWPLVVPLYRGKNRLDVESITIIDRQSGDLILQTGI